MKKRILATIFLYASCFMYFSTVAQRAQISSDVLVKAQVKPDKPWKEYPARTIQSLQGFSLDRCDEGLDAFGGIQRKDNYKTGFFHTRKIGTRWWLIDPEGNRCFNRSVVSVTVGSSKIAIKERETNFGSTRTWADSTTRLIRQFGFNGTGAWSDSKSLREVSGPLPHTLLLNFMSTYGKHRGGTFMQPGHVGYPNDCIFTFDPEFEKYCDEYASKLSENKNDPYLIGYFSDNELPFPADALDKYLQFKKTDAGYLAAEQWLKKRNHGVVDTAAITNEDQDAFLEYLADHYFGLVSRAIRKHDPNHMFIGARFYGHSLKLKPLFVAAGRYLDAISINYYNVWTPGAEQMQQWVQWSGKPIIITEWYVKGADSGLPNSTGAGWIVPTQNDRGLFYQNFTLTLLQFKGCIGWHWFRYMDNDPADKKVDPSNNDANKGIVTIKFEPYLPLLEKMKEVNQRVYRLIDYFDLQK